MRVSPKLEKQILETPGVTVTGVNLPTPPSEPVDEKDFMAEVVKRAKALGWLVYHTYSSRKSQPGFPDLVLLRAGVMVVAELKTEKGKTTAEQDTWLEAFHNLAAVAAVSNVRVFLWRPQDWPQIEEVLR